MRISELAVSKQRKDKIKILVSCAKSYGIPNLITYK